MRILHLISSHRWTGAAEPASALALAQIALGHEVRFACIKGESFWKQLKKLNVPREEHFDLRTGLHPFAVRADLRQLRKFVAEKSFDVIHCHLPHDHWLAAAGLGRLMSGTNANRKDQPILVRTFHRDIPPRADFLHRRLYAEATDALICVSRSGRGEAMRQLGLGENRVAWVRGAVDIERFHPGLDREANRSVWGISSDAPIAGLVARMQPHRGHMMFIDTITEVVKKVPNAVYVVAGRGELKHKIRDYVRAHPLASHLIRIGYRKWDLTETYAAMDVALMLVQGSDGTCRAMLEAMACGKPVIGSRIGAIADSIIEGVDGWLIEPNNPEALTNALCEALSDPVRLREMGRAAREKMEREFTQAKRAEETIKIYHRALESRS